jgi:hypothetical protein
MFWQPQSAAHSVRVLLASSATILPRSDGWPASSYILKGWREGLAMPRSLAGWLILLARLMGDVNAVSGACGPESRPTLCRQVGWPEVGLTAQRNLASFADLGQDAISTGAQGFEPPLQITAL